MSYTSTPSAIINRFPNDAVWDDLRFPATQTTRGQGLTVPEFDDTNLGYLMPQNDDGEILYCIAQFPHSYKLGSNVRPHIHFYQDEAEEPVFKIDYRWYNNGDTIPSFSTLTQTGTVFTYDSGTIAQYAIFGEINGSSINAVSSIMDIKIYRDDNVVSGDVLLKEFDIHYQIDCDGSRQEFIK